MTYEISEYLYEYPDNDLTMWYTGAEAGMYKGKPAPEFPKPVRHPVKKVTNKFVFVTHGLIKSWDRSFRLNRAELETNGFVYATNMRRTVCVWDVVEQSYADQRKSLTEWLDRTGQRVQAELEQAEQTGYKCAKCGEQADGLMIAQYQHSGNYLTMTGWPLSTTPYDGQLLCYSCRKAVWAEYGQSVHIVRQEVKL